MGKKPLTPVHFPSTMSKLAEDKENKKVDHKGRKNGVLSNEDKEKSLVGKDVSSEKNFEANKRSAEAKAEEETHEMLQVVSDQMLKFIIWKCDYTLKSLTNLPDKVIEQIISRCDPRSRNRLRLTCKKIHEIEGKTAGSSLMPVLTVYVHWSPSDSSFNVGYAPLGKWPTRRIECTGLNLIEAGRVLARMCNIICTVRVYVKLNLGDKTQLYLLHSLPYKMDLNKSKLLKIRHSRGQGRASVFASERIATTVIAKEVTIIWMFNVKLPKGSYAKLYEKLKQHGDRYDLVMNKRDKCQFVEEVFGLGSDYSQEKGRTDVTTTKKGEIYFCELVADMVKEDKTFSCGIPTVVRFDEGWMTLAAWSCSAKDLVRMEKKSKDEIMRETRLWRIKYTPPS